MLSATTVERLRAVAAATPLQSGQHAVVALLHATLLGAGYECRVLPAVRSFPHRSSWVETPPLPATLCAHASVARTMFTQHRFVRV